MRLNGELRMVHGEMVQDCFICSKHRNAQQFHGDTIYEDELVYVGHTGSNEERCIWDIWSLI